jgi:hypothetical protein
MRTLNYLNCSNCQAIQIKLSRGISFNFFDDKLTTFGFMYGMLQNLIHDQTEAKRFRIGPEIEIGALLKVVDSVKFRTVFSQNYNLTDQFSPQAYLQTHQLSFYPLKQLSLNLEYKKNFGINSNEMKNFQELTGLVSFYY